MNKLFFTNNLCKNFSTKAKIKFIGKRSLLDSKSLETQTVNNANFNNQTTQQTPQNQTLQQIQNEKPRSSSTFSFQYRPQITLDEIEVINNGGVNKIPDWNKIRVKTKKL